MHLLFPLNRWKRKRIFHHPRKNLLEIFAHPCAIFKTFFFSARVFTKDSKCVVHVLRLCACCVQMHRVSCPFYTFYYSWKQELYLNHRRTWMYKEKWHPFNVLLSATNMPRLRGFLLILRSLRVNEQGPRAVGARRRPLFSFWQQQHPCTSLIRVGPVYYALRIAESSSSRLPAYNMASHSYSLALFSLGSKRNALLQSAAHFSFRTPDKAGWTIVSEVRDHKRCWQASVFDQNQQHAK